MTHPEAPVPKIFPDGHYYSPILDTADLRRRSAQLWAPGGSMAGVDRHEPEQLALLTGSSSSSRCCRAWRRA